MINNKQVNKAISSLLGEEPLYDVRFDFLVALSDVSLEEAQLYVSQAPDYTRERHIIVSSRPDNYCEDIELSLYAAKRIAERNNQTFVLSLEDGTWIASFGDYGNCAQYKGSNPAYCSCMAILQFIGKL